MSGLNSYRSGVMPARASFPAQKGTKMKRMKVNQAKSKRAFTKAAMKTNYKNVAPPPMRGGYRI